MIAATLDPAAHSLSNIRFRGEALFFWLSQWFKGIEFYPADKLNPDYDVLVIFDSRKFLDIEPAGISELRKVIKSLKHSSEIVSLAGSPLFILSREAVKEHCIRIEPGICSSLSKNPKIRVAALKNVHRTLDLAGNPDQVETCIMRFQIHQLQKKGVHIEDYRHFYLEGRISIGSGSRIGPGVVVKGNSRLGKNVHLYPNCYIENTTIGSNSTVLPHCVLRDSVLEDDVQVGPYTHLRNHTVIKRGGKAGNFVEMKKTILGKGTKAMHLSYLGDSVIGEQVNIGAGTITCNYDGHQKHITTIEDHVFVGSGTELIAPLKIGRNSMVAAGSTITEDVPPDSLAIARESQSNKKDWVKNHRKKKQKPK
jgi:bifunctional UDP-N-acetylglucosamine pyrophosphorylase/glucosamine-1-phosphate N-acetyltransferase